MVEYTRFYSEGGELLGEEINDYSCSPYKYFPGEGYDYDGHCGGCYTCMMMQVLHYGFDGVMVTGERNV